MIPYTRGLNGNQTTWTNQQQTFAQSQNTRHFLENKKSTDQPVRANITTSKATYHPICRGLTHSHTTLAVGFLFDRLSTSTFSDCVPVLLRNASQTSTLQSSLTALALCYFSDSVRSPTLKREAQKAYSAALTKLQQIICMDDRATLDETIASSLLLAQYQSFADHDTQAWSVHVHGALALVDQCIARSSLSMVRHETQVMVVQTISLVQLDCLVNHKRLPTSVTVAFKNSLNVINDNANTFFSLVQSAMNLRSDLTIDRCSMDQLDHAKLLDKQAMQLSQAIPDEDYQGLLSEHSEARRRVSSAHTVLIMRAILNDMILELISRLYADAVDGSASKLACYGQQAEHSLAEIHQAIYEQVPPWIFSTYPTTITDDLDMWLCSLTWPFSYQLSLKHLSEELKRHTRAQLLKLANIATHPGLKKVIANALEGSTTGDNSYKLYLC